MLSDVQFYDKYSRFDYTTNQREDWQDTVTRVTDYLWTFDKTNAISDDLRQKIYNAIYNKDVMPSMRNLAMAGKAAERQNACSYNCSAIPLIDLYAFKEAVIILMSGSGLGYSVEKRYIDKLPAVKKQSGDIVYHAVEDTTEGWADAVYVGLLSWFRGFDVVFDYSKVRPAGTPLIVKGGRASGPEILEQSLNKIREIILSAQDYKLRPIQVHDIMCHLAACIVSGGVRRSACISLFDYDDYEMATCKNPKNIVGNEQRYLSNNSAVWLDRKTRKEVELFMNTMFDSNMGEPGIFSRYAANKNLTQRRSEAEFLTNPCQPGFAKVLTKTGIADFDDIDVGSIIWSEDGWVTVVNKMYTGIKPVYEYKGENEYIFVGTENHNLKDINGTKIEVDTAYKNLVPVQTLRVDGDVDTMLLLDKTFLGGFPVYSITVSGKSHTYWSSNINTSNCGEIFLRPFQFCNLSSVVCRTHDTKETLKEKVYYATIIGTLQSMSENFPGLRPEWRDNQEEERLLGVDLNGIMDVPLVRNPYLLDDLREYAVKVNAEFAEKLGINQSVAVTCIKPSGNSSVFLDTSPGIHTRWADYYIRRVELHKDNPVLQVLQFYGVPTEKSHYKNDTFIAAFPVKAPEGAITNGHFSAIEQLENWKLFKEHWTEHNPSVTITYEDHEKEDIIEWVYKNQNVIGGLSFLPKSDAHYEQMPYEAITKEKYEELMKDFPTYINWETLHELERGLGDLTNASQLAACSGDKCLITY